MLLSLSLAWSCCSEHISHVADAYKSLRGELHPCYDVAKYEKLHPCYDATENKSIRISLHQRLDGSGEVVSVDCVLSAPQKVKQRKLLISQVVGTKSSQVCVEDPPAVADGQGRRVCVNETMQVALIQNALTLVTKLSVDVSLHPMSTARHGSLLQHHCLENASANDCSTEGSLFYNVLTSSPQSSSWLSSTSSSSSIGSLVPF